MDMMILSNSQLMIILNIFIESPSIEIIQSDLEKRTGFSRTTIIKWVNLLANNKFLIIRNIGRSKLLGLNNDSVIIKELKRLSILMKLNPLCDIANEKGLEIYLYGSCARGEYVEASDIDLLIIGKSNRSDLVNFLEKLEEAVKREISFKVFSPLEWSRMRIDDKPFYERVEKDKVRIV